MADRYILLLFQAMSGPTAAIPEALVLGNTSLVLTDFDGYVLASGEDSSLVTQAHPVPSLTGTLMSCWER